MNEQFLQFIWQFQLFDKNELITHREENLTILKPGTLNNDAGPDFLHGCIYIDHIEWNGSVEIHVRSSDWLAHNHSQQGDYDNVILHVVWKNDRVITGNDGMEIPTLELYNRLNINLLNRYKLLQGSLNGIACAGQLNQVDRLTRLAMLDRALLQRLENKSLFVQDLLKANCGNWEETTYQLLAKNFGFKINNDSFFTLSCSLPYKILLKHGDKIPEMEALLFGQAGLLEDDMNDTYLDRLCRTYQVLSCKYQLEPRLKSHQWKFLRLRPANFPTIRIAQFAALLYEQKNLFAMFKESNTFTRLLQKLSVLPFDYWRNHYRFGKMSKSYISGLGESSIQNIAINTVVPLLVAYSKETDQQFYLDRAIRLLESIPAENNNIIRYWKSIGMDIGKAQDSQALLELYHGFCKQKKCLSCHIGVTLVKSDMKI